MILPPRPWAIICFAAACIAVNTPNRLTRSTLLEQLGVHLQERGERVDAGVVDKDVQPTEALDGSGDHRVYVGSPADVCLHGEGAAADARC